MDKTSVTRVVCRECGEAFFSTAPKLKNGRGKYCSSDCYRAFNKVRVSGGIAYIELTTQRREFVADTLIDVSDLAKIRAYGGRVVAEQKKEGRRAYVRGGGKAVYLHRAIMDAALGQEVDHINNNTLDNRKANLRIVNRVQNSQNRKGANRNSASGIRNVSWDASKQKWEVSLSIRRRKKFIGRYEHLADAERVAKWARATYMTHAHE